MGFGEHAHDGKSYRHADTWRWALDADSARRCLEIGSLTTKDEERASAPAIGQPPRESRCEGVRDCVGSGVEQ